MSASSQTESKGPSRRALLAGALGGLGALAASAINVTSSSFVLLTPKTNIGSRALWFTTDPAGNKFTIHMSSSRSSGTRVAWLLLG
jgi:hypothetical protein